MDKEWKKKWLEALRSGKYKQGQNELRSKDNSFCCLGVLCDIAGGGEWSKETGEDPGGRLWYYKSNGDRTSCYLSHDVVDRVGLDRTNPILESLGSEYSVSALNDSEMSFEELADLIEDQL